MWWMCLLLVTAASPAAASSPDPAAGPVTVIVELEDAPVAAYRGTIPGLAATSPAVTGAARLDPQAPAVQAYLAYLAGKQQEFEAAAREAVPGARVLHRYRMVLNGVALRLPEDRIPAIAGLPGVAAVRRDTPGRLDRDPVTTEPMRD
jgi:hypothetical protein